MVHQPAGLEKSVLTQPLTPILPSKPGVFVAWRRLRGSARGLALVAAARRYDRPIVIASRDIRSARELQDEIHFYAAGAEHLPVLAFPDWESLPYDLFAPHPDLVSERLATLHRLSGLERGIVLVAAATLAQRLPPRRYIAAHSFIVHTGEILELDKLRQRLAQGGYQSVSQVLEPGEFAVRGGLLDLYPIGSGTPFRIDLFDNQVESIREFDSDTQRSRRKLERVELLPAREYPLTDASIQQFRRAFRARFEGDPQKVELYREVSKGLAPPGVEYYLPLFFDHTDTLFDYLRPDTLCVLEAGAEPAVRSFLREVDDRYAQLRHDRERPLLRPDELFLAAETLNDRLRAYPCIRLEDVSTESEERAQDPEIDAVLYDTGAPERFPVNHKSEHPYGALMDHLRSAPGRTLIVAETPGRRETLRALLRDNAFEPEDVAGWGAFLDGGMKLALIAAALEKGLTLRSPDVVVITELQLYGERAAQRRRRARRERDPEVIVRGLAELRLGDPVVHEEHGVGRYLGLQTLDVGDGATEFLTLEYAGGDKLYLPVLSLHLISRYTGTDPEHAPLHKLGGDAWEKAKQRARQKAHDAAAELLEVLALRLARAGHAFTPRDTHYQAFADAFPFEETPDQSRAIEEVLTDMENPKPTDRLVCGDVGFGKTEVAMRAAFLAVHDGKQVAVLVPTTLLVQQHFRNFRDRFAGLPYRIESLSRFQSKADQAEVLKGLGDGSVHVVIGTHRLLQGDVRFANLGLVILDEEHRFGVRQKERLKRLRAEADILTLTATPIPRTLNMSLAGLRDISIIATAPEGRLSVKTLVSEWNRGLIREACVREIRRGGQVYYLHNEVRTIDRTARQLQELLPEAEIRVAHGQLPERELERIMLDFYHHRFNVLVCSTIIESGIDVPSANTIIIERADKFGLAQLHQLRGRVGRSHHRAYAYLLVPGRGVITEDACKRLEAIESLEELGSGFTLASHDLEIRGAGELLGEAQSGEIDEVGFTLYSELLQRAVNSLKTGHTQPAANDASGAEVNLHAPTLFPEDYLPDVHQRLILYKRIAGARGPEELIELQEEIIDRFGLLPDPAKLLFKATAIKIRATSLGINKIDAGKKGVRIEFTANPTIDLSVVLRLLHSAPRTYKLDGPNRLRILTDNSDVDQRLRVLNALFDELATGIG